MKTKTAKFNRLTGLHRKGDLRYYCPVCQEVTVCRFYSTPRNWNAEKPNEMVVDVKIACKKCNLWAWKSSVVVKWEDLCPW